MEAQACAPGAEAGVPVHVRVLLHVEARGSGARGSARGSVRGSVRGFVRGSGSRVQGSGGARFVGLAQHDSKAEWQLPDTSRGGHG